jgi:hypothetical protein
MLAPIAKQLFKFFTETLCITHTVANADIMSIQT